MTSSGRASRWGARGILYNSSPLRTPSNSVKKVSPSPRTFNPYALQHCLESAEPLTGVVKAEFRAVFWMRPVRKQVSAIKHHEASKDSRVRGVFAVSGSECPVPQAIKSRAQGAFLWACGLASLNVCPSSGGKSQVRFPTSMCGTGRMTYWL